MRHLLAMIAFIHFLLPTAQSQCGIQFTRIQFESAGPPSKGNGQFLIRYRNLTRQNIDHVDVILHTTAMQNSFTGHIAREITQQIALGPAEVNHTSFTKTNAEATGLSPRVSGQVIVQQIVFDSGSIWKPTRGQSCFAQLGLGTTAPPLVLPAPE